MDDLEFRYSIYQHFASHGGAPADEDMAAWMDGREAAAAALWRLHEAHAIVLDADGSIRMALPFSAIPTTHRVISADRSWWANCAWDALAVPVALGIDASIEATWLDTGEPVDLSVADGDLSHHDGYVHFRLPANRWWDDVIET